MKVAALLQCSRSCSGRFRAAGDLGSISLFEQTLHLDTHADCRTVVAVKETWVGVIGRGWIHAILDGIQHGIPHTGIRSVNEKSDCVLKGCDLALQELNPFL